jgi:hypothetical protein
MSRGAIDASEWVGPWLDMAMGLHKAVGYYTTTLGAMSRAPAQRKKIHAPPDLRPAPLAGQHHLVQTA